MDGELFHVDRLLLNSKFEGYKLHIIPQDDSVLQFSLANRPTQAAASGKIPLTFQEVQSRITHNHLTVHSESGRAVYIDADYNVVLIELDQERINPRIRRICELPKPIRSDTADTGIHREYPSGAFFSPTSLLVSDGQGLIYLLNLDGEMKIEGATVAATFILPSNGVDSIDSPFRIHGVHSPSPFCVIAILSSRFYPSKPLEIIGKCHTPIQFDVWGVKLNLTDLQTSDIPTQVEVLWRRRGEDALLYTTFDKEHGSYILIGGSEYHKLDTLPPSTHEPTPEELAPAPRCDEFSTTPNVISPPPYSWTQTSDSVTVAIPIPSTTPKHNVKVLISSTTLTFHIDSDGNSLMPHAVSAPRYSAKKLWDRVSSSSSFWTFDREAEHTYGILSLHLEKQNEGTRWSHLFASTGTGSTAGEDVEVPETLDPSELWNIREALEKYTAALQGDDASGLGFGKGVPSLSGNELDEEVDSSVGRKAFVTWVPDPSSQAQTELQLRKQYSTPFQLLSVPIPGQNTDRISLIIKHGIDGVVFALDGNMADNSELPSWKHSVTYPALAFVLTSKRDTRFTYHISNKAVLALESGSNNRGGNMYIYYPSGPNTLMARQSILKINGGQGCALMGVGLFTGGNGQPVIACLTEEELTLIRGI